jgi:hypothetical protein
LRLVKALKRILLVSVLVPGVRFQETSVEEFGIRQNSLGQFNKLWGFNEGKEEDESKKDADESTNKHNPCVGVMRKGKVLQDRHVEFATERKGGWKLRCDGGVYK